MFIFGCVGPMTQQCGADKLNDNISAPHWCVLGPTTFKNKAILYALSQIYETYMGQPYEHVI